MQWNVWVLRNVTNYSHLLLFKLSAPHGVAKENCLPRNHGEMSRKVGHFLLVVNVSWVSVLSMAPVMLKYHMLWALKVTQKSTGGLLNPCVFFNKNKATAKTESNNVDLPYGTRSFCLWSRAAVITWSARREGNWQSSSVSYEDNDFLCWVSKRWAKDKQLVLQRWCTWCISELTFGLQSIFFALGLYKI